MLEHRTRDGRTVWKQFVASRPELSEAERATLLCREKVVEGIFEVGRHDGDTAVMAGLVDELTDRVRSNAGPQLLRQLVLESTAAGRTRWIKEPSAETPRRRPYDAHMTMREPASAAASFLAAAYRNVERLE